jgi:hypothetical protein
MCLLTFYPAGRMPDTTALLNGVTFNDDGHGFAIVTKDHLIVRRGMHAEMMIETFDAARRAHPHGPALFHSRFGTHGNRTIDNCHPFPIGGDNRTVMAHNGILPAVVQPAKGDPRCDTRIAAEDYLPLLGPLRARRTRLRLQRWMTRRNKIVILTVDQRFKDRAYILNEEAGIWNGGIWYSNDGYLPPKPNPRGLTNQSDWRWPAERTWDQPDLDRTDYGRCGYCSAIIDPLDHACRYCGWCLDCGDMPEDCQCFTPPALDPGPPR